MSNPRRPHNQEITLRFLEQKDVKEDLLFVNSLNAFFLYSNGHYEHLSDHLLREKIFRFILTEYPGWNIATNQIEEVIQQIKWIAPHKVEEIGSPYLAFDDCLLDLLTFETLPFDKNIPVILHIPFSYSSIKAAVCPKFEAFLRSSLVKEDDHKITDEELIPFVQEVMGYYLIPNLKGAVAFFFVGSGANGKSVLADVIGTMVGRQYLSSISIEALTTDRFASSHLVGKFLNVCNEEESKFAKADKFKALVTGELMTGEKKFGDHFEFRPQSKFLFCSNALPTFAEMNYGLKRRIKILPFNRRFAESERDTDLIAKLHRELPGIVRFALEGAKRFVKRNFSFDDPKQVKEAIRDFEVSSSSVIAFSEEHLQETKTKEEGCSSASLYAIYKKWIDLSGRKPVNLHNFSKELSSFFPHSLIFQQRSGQKNLKFRTITVKDTSEFANDEALVIAASSAYVDPF